MTSCALTMTGTVLPQRPCAQEVTGREERGAEGFMNLQGPHGEELGCGEFVVIRELQAVTNYSPSLNPKARVYQWITKG